MAEGSNDSSTAGGTPPFRIGRWEIHPQLNRITDGAETVQIEPRLTQVLVCLAERPGGVVRRSEFLQRVWPDVVVGEENLTGAISELRRILGDDAQTPRYIETIRKAGYRLVAQPEWLAEKSAAAQAKTTARWSRGALAGIAAVAVAGIAVLTWTRLEEPQDFDALLATGLDQRPFTSFDGNEVTPAISPDGLRVAFAWAAKDAGPSDFDVFVKQENTETPLRLTDSPGFDAYPAWSPDGTWVSYYHQDEAGSGIYVVPSIGGERRLLIPGPGLEGGHAWSPDGRRIVYAERRGLYVLERESGTTSRLTDPPARCCGDGDPRYSPDGRTIAFVRTDGARLHDLYLVPATGGTATRLTKGLVRVRGFDWSGDGSALVTSSLRGGRYGLWRVDPGNGVVEPVPTGDGWVLAPTLARQADVVSYQKIDLEINVWRYQSGEDPVGSWIGEPLIASTRIDLEAAYSPDGERIAFTSGRSGSLELWTCAADGSRPMRLTSFGGVMVTGPVWSPDGKQIAFTACPGDSCETYVVAAEGGQPRALTDTPYHTAVSGWSFDGEWLYVASDRDGRWELYATRPDDPEQSRQLTTRGGISGRESMDGRFFYFSRPEQPGLWRIDLAAGATAEPEEILADMPTAANPGQWDLCSDGIVGVGRDEKGAQLKIYLFDSGTVVELARILELSSIGIGVSPDCSSVLVGSAEQGASDLMVANFGEARPGGL